MTDFTQNFDVRQELSRIRQKNESLHLAREAEIREKLPAVAETEAEISRAALAEARNRISSPGKDTGNDDAEKNIRALQLQKQKLLTGAGYPADYLDMIYNCPICHDTGAVGGQVCRCVREMQRNFLSSVSNLDKRLSRENFDHFSLDYFSREKTDPKLRSPYDNMKDKYNAAWKFIRDFDTRHGNILMYGEPGVGKTFLSSCIAREILKANHSVFYLTANEIFEGILAPYLMQNDKRAALEGAYRYLYDCDLLIIDDLGTEVVNRFVSSQLFELVNRRILENRSTIISANQSLQQLEERYSERIVSRFVQYYAFYYLYGKNIRYIRKIEQKRSS